MEKWFDELFVVALENIGSVVYYVFGRCSICIVSGVCTIWFDWVSKLVIFFW